MALNIVYQPKQAQGFIEDCNGVPLHMILIRSETFMMGSPETEYSRYNVEGPQHQVSVPQFFMGRYPITQAQWKKVAELKQISLPLNPDCSYFKGDNRPVETVSWQEAIEFCARLSRHTGRNYRLPSEAEWEYACRAGTTTPFYFGETISTKLANYDGTQTYARGEAGNYQQETTDVTQFGVANAFGLSDMHGNVCEWCLDPWHDNYDNAPTNGGVWDEENKNDNRYQNILSNTNALMQDRRYHVLRGGSWNDYPRICRSAFRNGNDRCFSSYGFRVVSSQKS